MRDLRVEQSRISGLPAPWSRLSSCFRAKAASTPGWRRSVTPPSRGSPTPCKRCSTDTPVELRLKVREALLSERADPGWGLDTVLAQSAISRTSTRGCGSEVRREFPTGASRLSC